uniref:Uncharacterized protein n=1 Tax=Glossina morsitans morsitans TaxID=37546 RepID=A0A1B0FDI7_GLOMM
MTDQMEEELESQEAQIEQSSGQMAVTDQTPPPDQRLETQRANQSDEHMEIDIYEQPTSSVQAQLDDEEPVGPPQQPPQANVDDDPEGEANEQSSDSLDTFRGFDEMDSNLENKDMSQVLQYWESKHTQSGFDPVPILKRLAEIFEKETEIYMRKDPDPFDERHPYRTDPSCQFGFLLKQLFRKDHFMKKLVNDYLRDNYFTRQSIQKSSLELNILALRLILVIMPGLETSAVFQVEFDNLIHRIYNWAEDSIEPLQSYATGLLAAAMEVTDIAVTFRELNTRLVPKMIKRLHMLQAVYKSCTRDLINHVIPSIGNCITALNIINNSTDCETAAVHLERVLPSWMTGSAPQSPLQMEDSPTTSKATEGANNAALDVLANNSNMSTLLENSRETLPSARIYKKMYIAIHPPTAETSQMLILRYLTTMGEYQEFLGLFLEHNAIQLIFGYIENLDSRDTCLAFEALKYLASLLCHKKFALEFISHGGLELLLKVPRPSIAATGVSITLYYLAYTEDAMERICTMPKSIITQLVKYALWILGHSYDSGKCHATMFFGLSFQFKIILDEFDAQDGLRKLYNVISVLKILNPSSNEEDGNNDLNEDVESASRQIVRHVCVALKRYMESHLFYKYNSFMRQQFPSSAEFNQNITKAAKANLEQISDQIRTLQENTSVRAHWAPVDQLLKLGGITLLLKIIAFSYEWNNGGRSETVRSALDVLSICCVIPRVYLAYCGILELPDHGTTTGVFSILGAAAGDIVPDADVQKSALAVLCHCKDPITLMKCLGSSKKSKQSNRYSEELVEKVWESVCSNNGIIVLLSLMQIKTPITDADCIRGMACRALAGLARSQRVRQIVGKLPLFASGQIQTLMRDPILQEKRAEHVIFQKYALELLEQVSGKTKPLSHQLDPSLANIHKANVIAQTKIQYNEQQLYQLIYDHLESKGLTQTAHMLQKEANLQLPSTTTKNFHQSPFDYKVMTVSSIGRSRLRSRMPEINQAINGAASTIAVNGPTSSENVNGNLSDDAAQNAITPIKLVRKTDKSMCNSIGPNSSHSSAINTNSANCIQSSSQRSLQKQISVADINNIVEVGSPPLSMGITLSTIVTEYLTNQHALCNNPMTTCPQFDLFTPHKCPDPKPNRVLGDNINITARLFKAQAGFNTRRFDRRYVHSNFAPWHSIRSNDYNEIEFTSCHIVENTNLLLVGTHQGEAKVFNMNEGTELFSSRCHSYLIDSIQSNRKGDLVLTSSSWRSPLSVLWSISHNDFISKLQFNDEFYCEFSKLTQDKIIGTQSDCSIIYDVQTGQKVSTFKPAINIRKNRATFCPADELVLSDGVLWDVKSGKEIHKFDKLNQSLSGIFHPNGLEIISNTEVWDLRTFHLLQTIPVLDQCYIKFSPMHVLYGISLEVENRNEFDDSNTYETSFKVLDAYDYSSISTIDVKRNIYDLSVSGNGSLIALVENQPSYDTKPETFVKIYAVGMKKHEHEEEVRGSCTNFQSSGGSGAENNRAAAGGEVSSNRTYETTAASSNGGVGVRAVLRPRAAGRVYDITRGGGDGGDGDIVSGHNSGRQQQLSQPQQQNHNRHAEQPPLIPLHNENASAYQRSRNSGSNINNISNRVAGLRAALVNLEAAGDIGTADADIDLNILLDLDDIALNLLSLLEDDEEPESEEDNSDSDASTEIFDLLPNDEIRNRNGNNENFVEDEDDDDEDEEDDDADEDDDEEGWIDMGSSDDDMGVL